ncbi:DNA repair ATPase [Methylomarinum vadi]|uniref:DNA repair ATPase n=1 Tax=Methylomarinum vadi TaxID=438855 RepID=UPI0004DF4DED|nr:DNA repair ATPase [Methylomarinum vadi]
MATEQTSSDIQQAVAAGGAYDVIRKRLEQQGEQLQAKINRLNEARAAEFGQTELSVVGRVRVRTENNCVPRDIVRVGNKLILFGYNVFLGLKKETEVGDVFNLYRLVENGDGFEVEPFNDSGSFLNEKKFVADFKELYQYYKDTRLLSLHVVNERLLAVFQIGRKLEDVRVFRWQISGDQVNYIDNRGERDRPTPPRFDFEWTPTRREDHVQGSHPHISILDKVFVETIGGDLTIKVENNTEDGLGIYREPVEDQHQSLADAEIHYAELGSLILLKIKPYREEHCRYLVFNSRTQQVDRIDAIGQSCVQLPEDHGLVFPGGYYLQNGDNKVFDNASEGLRFAYSVRSPNGEDVLYVFHEPEAGISALFSYNLIDKTLQNPIIAHGSCLFRDGHMLAFRAEDDEPTRIHPMQVWQTPYFHEEYQLQQPVGQSFFGKIGNSELVRGISDAYSLVHAIHAQQVSTAHYEDLIAAGQRMFDAYHWLHAPEVEAIGDDIQTLCQTAELVLDEFEKVSSIRKQSGQALAEAQTRQQQLLDNLYIDSWRKPQEYVDALDGLRRQLGHLNTIKELRYIDLAAVETLRQEIDAALDRVGQATVKFLSEASALQVYHDAIADCLQRLDKAQATIDIEPLAEQLEQMSVALDLLNETLAGIKVHDTQVRTAILQALSELYGKLNQAKAQTRHKSKSFRSEEAVAEFAAQFKLFSQSINSALETVATPLQCDDQLSRLSTQLEELESRFADFDEFLGDIVRQREQLFEAFQSRKQALLDERQRRSQNIGTAIERILDTVRRRSQSFQEADALNTYLASDPMILKLRQLIEQLRELEASVQADDAEAKLKTIQELALRSLRDRQDIFEADGNVIRLGKHRFSVNRQNLDLTLINRQGQLVWHLIGTDFYQAADEPRLNELRDFWQQSLISETERVYRGEFLAASILHSAEQSRDGLSLDTLYTALPVEGELLRIVRQYTTPRFQEGYEKGIHDSDACAILKLLLPLLQSVGLLRYTPEQRALALAFWRFAGIDDEQKQNWQRQAQSAARLLQSLGSRQALEVLSQELSTAIAEFLKWQALPLGECDAAAEYLCAELSESVTAFATSQSGRKLAEQLLEHLGNIGHRAEYQAALQHAQSRLPLQWRLTEAWLQGLLEQRQDDHLRRFIPEAVMIVLADNTIERQHNTAALDCTIEELIGEHPRIRERKLTLSVDEFGARLSHHREVICPGFRQYQDLRQSLTERQRATLHLDSFRAQPLTSFVRNQLINDVYLPLIGDNLAKQMGTVGDNKRTDLMGLLLLISPPGYGKTTLMEYVANRLGLIFMKINCPSLGHQVHSLDPSQAPNATAAQELEKLNLGLEMGNNVMLYLDDIQHTHAEFLQKFISLCDGSRRIEGVWRGQSKTYDLRGKKFCVIMAGNPYTESGEVFKIPDMLANRADIYNLGDVLSGNDAVFAQSYLENSLTSNAVLQPLAMRSMADVYRFIRLAQGENIASSDFEHGYSGSESNEIVAVLKNLLKVRDVVLAVNQQYIASAAQDDRYRSEPPFKLQGSYRNMNKMAEKITAILNEEELQAIISDHYVGEAQTLTRGAEENLLKLKQIRGVLSDEESVRWETIKNEYARRNRLGDADDPAQQLVNQLSYISDKLAAIGERLQSPSPMLELNREVAALREQLGRKDMQVEVINHPQPGVDQALQKMAELFEVAFMPVFSAMEHKIKMEHDIWDRVKELNEEFDALRKNLKERKGDG